MAKSSIHIAKGNAGFVVHSLRENFSYSVVFRDEKNEHSTDLATAMKIYRKKLAERSAAYSARTGQKLQQKAATILSAVVNLEKHHTLADLKPIIEKLENDLDTKVIATSIHRDEGKLVKKSTGEEYYSGEDFALNDGRLYWIDSKKNFTRPIDMTQYEVRKNYHAHIEFMGIDSNGKAIKRNKLHRHYLSSLQDFVAETLQMERGKKLSKTKHKDPSQFKKEGVARRKGQSQELARMKDLREENKRLREQLRQMGASRAQYAALEKEVRWLREQVKAKEISIDDLQTILDQKFRQIVLLKEEIEEERKKRIEAERRIQELLTPTFVVYVVVEGFDEKEYIRRLRHLGWSVSGGRGDSQFVIRSETGEEIEDKGERLVGSPEGDMETQARMMFEIAIAKGWDLRNLIFVGDVKFQIVASRLKEEYWKYQREKDLQRLQGGRKRFHEGSGLPEGEKMASRPIPTGELDPSMRLAEVEEAKMTKEFAEKAIEKAEEANQAMKKPVKEAPRKAAYRQGNPFIPRR